MIIIMRSTGFNTNHNPVTFVTSYIVIFSWVKLNTSS